MNAALAPTLTAADRCDRCGAQAYVRARFTRVESSCSARTTAASTSRPSRPADIHDESERLHGAQLGRR